MRSLGVFRYIAHFCDGTFFFVLDFADEVVAGLCALDLPVLEVFDEAVERVVDCVFAPVAFASVVDVLRRWLADARCATTGSAT